MALYKKEVLVRPNSSADFEAAMNFARDWLMNSFQDKPENKDENGNYIDYFFAAVTFAKGHATNGGQIWLIFAPPCEQKYSMTPDPNTGRIEFITADLDGVNARIEAVEQTVTENSNQIENHEVRIEALENTSNDEVEATVI
ncbi:hypothetical protein [Nitratifractor salsuginis]|uniref:Uncharacterized protein n=1 Tax=Nitratifractor salsuginis (strain DSM 16511 / JCM 12458 / E9I37-1) TaxID=749222 RepID=E6WY48_NITSE|nr:hypothetical protein [Nitratifractor salsuginis]ADV46422.1 hypothetical protein Nitsa_1169 [Nitratifractor salsuginis DSM 16511]